MPTCLLVHGCGQNIYGQRFSETQLRAINLRLADVAFPPMSASDFAAVHIAGIFSGQAVKTRRARGEATQVIQQVYKFLTDATSRLRAMETVASAIDSDTRIVIAHSLGTVAAYDALCRLPHHNVELFLTLASPLAIPRYVRGRLSAISAQGRPVWPGPLTRWVNFLDYRDPVAMYRLRSRFGNGRQVEDRPIHLGWRNPHRLAAYLTSDHVISSLGRTLWPDADSNVTQVGHRGGRRAIQGRLSLDELLAA